MIPERLPFRPMSSVVPAGSLDRPRSSNSEAAPPSLSLMTSSYDLLRRIRTTRNNPQIGRSKGWRGDLEGRGGYFCDLCEFCEALGLSNRISPSSLDRAEDSAPPGPSVEPARTVSSDGFTTIARRRHGRAGPGDCA